MTQALSRHRLRFALDDTSHAALQCRIQSQLPVIWRGTDLYIEVGFFTDSTFVDDFTNVVSITMEIHTTSPRFSAPLLTKTVLVADFDTGMTSEEWLTDAADQYHARFELSNSETNFDMTNATQEKISFWMVFSVTLTTGEILTMGATVLTCEEDATESGLTALGSSNPTFRLTSGGYLQIKNDDTGKFHTLWAKGVEGAQHLVLGPGED